MLDQIVNAIIIISLQTDEHEVGGSAALSQGHNEMEDCYKMLTLFSGIINARLRIQTTETIMPLPCSLVPFFYI